MVDSQNFVIIINRSFWGREGISHWANREVMNACVICFAKWPNIKGDNSVTIYFTHPSIQIYPFTSLQQLESVDTPTNHYIFIFFFRNDRVHLNWARQNKTDSNECEAKEWTRGREGRWEKEKRGERQRFVKADKWQSDTSDWSDNTNIQIRYKFTSVARSWLGLTGDVPPTPPMPPPPPPPTTLHFCPPMQFSSLFARRSWHWLVPHTCYNFMTFIGYYTSQTYRWFDEDF